MASEKLKLLYDTSRLSDIPSMASAISNRIAVFHKQHNALIDAAIDFFNSYPSLQADITNVEEKYSEDERKLNLIKDYEQKNGKLPVVKGHASTEKLLNELYRETSKDKKKIEELQAQILQLRTRQFECLETLIDNMLDLLDNDKIFSQFLGTLALSAPMPEEKVRCQLNEKRKPIYITTLMILLFDDVRRSVALNNTYIKAKLIDIFADNTQLLKTKLSALPNDIKMKYREELLKPLAKAALLQSIGSYSPELDKIYRGDRYRKLSTNDRTNLIKIINEKSLEYLTQGIGVPHQVFNSHEEKQAYTRYETLKLKFMRAIILSKEAKNNALYDLLKIPIVYSSFILSTKEKSVFEDIYEAYHIIEHGAYKDEYRRDFADLFLKIVGKFPIGSGIYFVSSRTKQIEKAIVSSLYPKNSFEPICKQITKGQIQSLTQAEIVVSRNDNIYYDDVRYRCTIDNEIFKNRFNNVFVWNPNEYWEVQIPARIFWKKDINVEPERSDEQH